MWDYFAGGNDLEPVVARRRGGARARRSPRIADGVDVPAVDGAGPVRRRLGRGELPRKGTSSTARRPRTLVRRRSSTGTHRRRSSCRPRRRPGRHQGRREPGDGRVRQPGDVRPGRGPLDGEGVQLQPEDFAPALSMTAVDGDPGAAARRTPADRRCCRPGCGDRRRPRDARSRSSGGRPRIVPATRRRHVRPAGRHRRLPRGARQHRGRPTLAVERDREAQPDVHHRGRGGSGSPSRSPTSRRTSPTRPTATSTSAAPRSSSTAPC